MPSEVVAQQIQAPEPMVAGSNNVEAEQPVRPSTRCRN